MPSTTLLLRLALAVSLLLSACVDGPGAPTRAPLATRWVIAPSFALPAAASPSQASALDAAFDRVDRFRMLVKRAATDQVVVDTVIVVTPGQSEYDLSVSVVPRSANEKFVVVLTAYQGNTELFTAAPITVTATPESATSSSAPTPVQVTLTYSGPGSTASSVKISPTGSVLEPGGTTSFGARVLDASGNAVSDVPLSWTSAAPTVATVDAQGTVSGSAEGSARIVVTTPTGLTARAWVYVVKGTLAYASGGTILVRHAAGGDAATRSEGGGASEPAWSPDGAVLYYAKGGSVYRAATAGALVDGGWPTVSPDGGKLAVAGGSGIVFVNADGSEPTLGPSGTTPVWIDPNTLILAGNGVERVGVDGTGRTTVAGGGAKLPAAGPDGRIAYVDGGALHVTGRATALATGVTGRPSWSPNGAWLVVPSNHGLLLVSTTDSAPPVVLPGLDQATDPAFQPSGSLTPLPTPTLTGLDPDPPVPGRPVTLLGSGFDVVIPANNEVFWPTPDGSVRSELTDVTRTRLATVMPPATSAGKIRVQTRGGNAVLDFVPTVGSIQVRARTPWATPVPGAGVAVVNDADSTVANGKTDSSGALFLPGLTPGAYTLHLTAPDGFTIQGGSTRSITLGPSTLEVDLVLKPAVAAVETVPSKLTVEAGGFASVTLVPLDARGDTIPTVSSVVWASSSPLVSASGSGLDGSLAGIAPGAGKGSGSISVTLDGSAFTLPVTVTSFIHGVVTSDSSLAASKPGAASGLEIVLKDGSGHALSTTRTDRAGRYRFGGLFAGAYTVAPTEPSGTSASPASASVTLGRSTPTGEENFTLSAAGGIAHNFRVLIFSGGHTNENPGILSEFTSRWPDMSFDTTYGAAPSVAFLSKFNVVLLYEDGVFSNSGPVGDSIARYIADGGNVVIGIFYWQDRSDGGFGSAGWGNLESLDPYTVNGSEYSAGDLDPSSIVPHPLTDSVTSLHVDDYRGGVAAKVGTTVVARWTDGVPLIGYRIGPSGQRIVGVSVFPGYAAWGSGFTGDFYKIWENALRWAAAGSTPVAAAKGGTPPSTFFHVPPPTAQHAGAHPRAKRSGTWGG